MIGVVTTVALVGLLDEVIAVSDEDGSADFRVAVMRAKLRGIRDALADAVGYIDSPTAS